MGEEEDELTYAEAGVDVAATEEAIDALIAATAKEVSAAYAGVIEIDSLRIGLTTDGVGTKLLVAEAIDRYDTIGIDCIAMNVNDLVAEGLRPVGFVDYIALTEPDDALMTEIGIGLAAGAARANVELMGGETAILPEVVKTFDLAGAAIGVANDDIGLGTVEIGDALVGLPSSGIHSNGLTLARKAVEREHDYTDPFPADPARSIGEVLLDPTQIYTAVVDVLEEFDIHGCAHITGGGLHNLTRMADHRYVIDDPLDVPAIFPFIQACGDVSDEEMFRTFNMGIGFVVAADPADADAIAEQLDGRVIGEVIDGEGVVVEGREIPEP